MLGIFGSGIGGLTVVRALLKVLPRHDMVYFGDTGRAPYGNKSPHTVARYAMEGADFLLDKGAGAIVIACHTASSLAYSHIVSRMGRPVFEMIRPAVQLALAKSKKQRIGVIGSRGTIASEVYIRLINRRQPQAAVYSRECPLLAPLVEEGWLFKPETAMMVKKYLHPLKVRQIDTLILGGSHFPVLKEVIQRKIGRRVTLIDPSLAVAAALRDHLEQNRSLDASLPQNGSLTIYASDVTDHMVQTARRLLKRAVDLKGVSV